MAIKPLPKRRRLDQNEKKMLFLIDNHLMLKEFFSEPEHELAHIKEIQSSWLTDLWNRYYGSLRNIDQVTDSLIKKGYLKRRKQSHWVYYTRIY